MVKKCCILFDNEDQSAEIEKMIRNGRTKGIELECEQFNVGSTEFDEVLSEGKIDTQKVVLEYKKRFKNKTFQLAAFDRDLSDPTIDGVDLIRHLTANNILKNTPKVIYSGLLQDIFSDLDTKNKTDLIKRIKTLVNNDVKGYFERDDYETDILNVLLNNEESIDLIIEDELNKFPDFIFRNKFVNKSFNGKTYAEISNFLDTNTVIRNEFKKEIIQHIIAYLTEKV
jgi:hypothetical protein